MKLFAKLWNLLVPKTNTSRRAFFGASAAVSVALLLPQAAPSPTFTIQDVPHGLEVELSLMERIQDQARVDIQNMEDARVFASLESLAR